MSDITRRDALLTIAATMASASNAIAATSDAPPAKGFRVRALTAGVPMADARDFAPIEAALKFLQRARQRTQDNGYEVQTIRVATSPWLLDASASTRAAALPRLVVLDDLVSAHGAVLSIGPLFARGAGDGEIPAWCAELVNSTKSISLSVAVATPEHGVHSPAVRLAADVTRTLATVLPGGFGNFRFAAAANIPAGTPFFPVGYAGTEPSLSVGCETPNLVREAFTGVSDPGAARDRLRDLLSEKLAPLETLLEAVAAVGRRRAIHRLRTTAVLVGVRHRARRGADCWRHLARCATPCHR